MMSTCRISLPNGTVPSPAKAGSAPTARFHWPLFFEWNRSIARRRLGCHHGVQCQWHPFRSFVTRPTIATHAGEEDEPKPEKKCKTEPADLP